jgi:hypothetical protein
LLESIGQKLSLRKSVAASGHRHSALLLSSACPLLLLILARSDQGTIQEAASAAYWTSTLAPLSERCATPAPDQFSGLNSEAITVKDSGKTIVLHVTDRFSVYLDDGFYPLDELESSPTGLLGSISNGSIRGPDCYPIMFEATGEGKLLPHDRDFRLQVATYNTGPASTVPLP